MWDVYAEDLLDSVSGAVEVDRAFIAPGPAFAHDCRLLAVHLAAARVLVPPASVGNFPILAGTLATRLDYVVTFVADCVPVQDDDGNPPAPDDLTEWSKLFLLDCSHVHTAILDWTAAVDAACSMVEVGAAVPRGPQGGVTAISWPVSIVPIT